MQPKTQEQTATTQTSITADEARAIAKEAYIYGFPLVDNYRIQYSYFVDKSNPEYKTTWNELYNNARVYTPDDKAIQSPNSDTPYSYIGADLRTEPLVITVPAVDKSRYYSLQFIDMYTHNFAYVGSRATGSEAGHFVLAGPYWMGEKPINVKDVIRCETDFAFVLYRTQLLNPDDIENVKKVQAGYKVQTLSSFMGNDAPPAAPRVDFIKPLSPEQQRTSLVFFNVLNFVLQFCPTHPTELSLMQRFAKLGIGAGKKFDANTLSPEVRKAIEEGMAEAWKSYTEVRNMVAAGKVHSGDVFGTREHLANNYNYRFNAAGEGIYGNSIAEAYYPPYFVDSTGQPMDGSHKYTVRFLNGQLPPVNAFWSITMYELPAKLLSANPLNRYLINSAMIPQLKKDSDGGITLYIQNESPGKDKESNWLPAPKGPFFCAMRLYWPKKEATDGTWKVPPMVREGSQSVSASPAPKEESQLKSNASSLTRVVTPNNFNRAESDMYFTHVAIKEGALGKFNHYRDLFSIDNQTVVRGNRDTLYSSSIFDLDAGPATITLPDAGDRFMSLMALNEDHYVIDVRYGAGSYTFTREQMGTRYCLLGLRTLVDPTIPSDLEKVHALQDAVKVNQPGGPGKFEVPAWDQVSQKKVRDALIKLGDTMPDFQGAFGKPGEVDPIKHLIGSAIGWGGNPEKDAIYLNIVPENNDGKTIYRLAVKEVPVDAFWSVTVYNATGYLEKNQQNAYSLNSITAKKNADGSVTIQFGGCDGKAPNCLPITPGWNYTVRLYRPRKEILDGTWKFPDPQPIEQ